MTFRTWLWRQHRRDDAVGDLARDVRRDPDLVGIRLTPKRLRDYLDSRDACRGAIDAVASAAALCASSRHEANVMHRPIPSATMFRRLRP